MHRGPASCSATAWTWRKLGPEWPMLWPENGPWCPSVLWTGWDRTEPRTRRPEAPQDVASAVDEEADDVDLQWIHAWSYNDSRDHLNRKNWCHQQYLNKWSLWKICFLNGRNFKILDTIRVTISTHQNPGWVSKILVKS